MAEFDPSGIHEGDTIYVVASGPSLDLWPRKFFDNVITIGVNDARSLVDCDYHCLTDFKVDPHVGDSEYTFLFADNFEDHDSLPENAVMFERRTFFEHNVEKEHTYSQCLRRKWDGELEMGFTCSYTAVNLALVMGAARIVTAGLDLCFFDNRSHAGPRGYRGLNRFTTPIGQCVENNDLLCSVEDQNGNTWLARQAHRRMRDAFEDGIEMYRYKQDGDAEFIQHGAADIDGMTLGGIGYEQHQSRR